MQALAHARQLEQTHMYKVQHQPLTGTTLTMMSKRKNMSTTKLSAPATSVICAGIFSLETHAICSAWCGPTKHISASSLLAPIMAL
eukprot:6436741-Amphidinium_carterae.2